MINDDKRVLEHFNHLLDITRDKEKITVNRQSIKYLVNKLEKYFTQTEQLQELTDEIYQHLEDKESLEQQNERYREALRFYADEKNYEDIGIPTGNNPPALPILEDRGQVARKELEGEE